MKSILAFIADCIPLSESSNINASSISRFIINNNFKNISGEGLANLTSSAQKIYLK